MTVKASEYKKHYDEFAQNVAYAARTWHHHVHLNNRAAEDQVILAALDKAARYWLDQRYAAVQTTIIFLGKIFDNDGRVHNVDKTLRAAHEEKEHFSKTELRKRKVESGGEFEGLDEYVQNATEPDSEDFKAISADRGHRGYMGSANMTISSLRSRMELGVILRGTAAAQLDRILRVVVTMAAPFAV